MPVTPLHVAFAWPFKMKFKALNFAALTMGAMVPDLEALVYQLLGLYPDRLVLHSLVGALSVDIVLTVVLVKLLAHAKLEKIGISGFASAKLDKYFIISAAIGSLSHVLVDSLHHEDNPLLWLIGPTYFTGPLVVAFGAPLAHSIIAAAAIAIIAFMFKKLLNDSGYGFLLVFRNPIKAMSVVTSVLLV
jgi:uncharacterized protein DUF4184